MKKKICKFQNVKANSVICWNIWQNFKKCVDHVSMCHKTSLLGILNTLSCKNTLLILGVLRFFMLSESQHQPFNKFHVFGKDSEYSTFQFGYDSYKFDQLRELMYHNVTIHIEVNATFFQSMS